MTVKILLATCAFMLRVVRPARGLHARPWAIQDEAPTRHRPTRPVRTGPQPCGRHARPARVRGYLPAHQQCPLPRAERTPHEEKAFTEHPRRSVATLPKTTEVRA
ncbi:hypothetical protein GCM10022402_19140 [Salinactinospora qingdaonensis]|uniref:Secreted protein n=1 Tax=Salinactinospora qingdaonensis TaxID=702744 RepID=A0ABP7FML2_9ACTN